ncbi:hypothetical protein NEOLEDRAFT_1052975 [Neolentinus lepideus HHB14362 ss-1]|uniref:Uncharacterized protein n=1 Tax=Neolentinus lepideus HHB14362 ss-1 TaxID=1314782 RepID=A0A165WA63_9AGAM|nr:hypothetical protein NEOLEDRAFT_1052975 [Neolentinus lepideus HHB14362 ss-1]
MSDQTAKIHTAVSNRAKAKQSLERKTVFKSVLDNPFRVRWPSIPMNIQNSILAHVIAMLDDVASYHLSRDQANRKRKRTKMTTIKDAAERISKRRKKDITAEVATQPAERVDETPFGSPSRNQEATSAAEILVSPDPPDMLAFLTIGINAVTKRLETQAKAARQVIARSGTGIAAPTPGSSRPVRIILACSGDIDPPILIGHLPEIVAACNSAARGHTHATELPPKYIKLVPLPRGAEFSLSEAIGLRRASVLAIDADAPGLSAIDDLINQVPTLAVSWLDPHSSTNPEQSLIPTHIKQTRTSVPKDSRAAKQQRAQGKADAKRLREWRGSRNKKSIKITSS